jgi:hypothetical protein
MACSGSWKRFLGTFSLASVACFLYPVVCLAAVIEPGRMILKCMPRTGSEGVDPLSVATDAAHALTRRSRPNEEQV